MLSAAVERRRPKIRWARWLVVIWLGLLLSPNAYYFLPGSYWFFVDSIKIENTTIRRSPLTLVDRTIKRPFHAKWIVTLKMQNANGGWYHYCNGVGENDYRTTVVLKPDLDLAWWMERDCGLLPGKYRAEFLWNIQMPNGKIKSIRRNSNVFEVKNGS